MRNSWSQGLVFQGPSLVAGAGRDVFPAEQLQPQAPHPNEEVCQLLLLSCHISSLKPNPCQAPSRQGQRASSLDINQIEPGSPNPQPPSPSAHSLQCKYSALRNWEILLLWFSETDSSCLDFLGQGQGQDAGRERRIPWTETVS